MKYSMFIGRWQPWHEGHRWLIDQRLQENKNILICIREVSNDDKNPYNPLDVKKNIEKKLSDLISQNKVKVIIIPDIESVNYGVESDMILLNMFLHKKLTKFLQQKSRKII